jgi:lysophospholipase L1-like esterase
MFNQYFGKYNPVNFGIGGDRTENVLWRLENGELIGTSPRVIVLLIGTCNSGMNTAEEMAVGIAAVVKALRTGCPQSRILLLGVFPKKDMTLEKTKAVNALVAKLDDKRMIRYLDVGANLLDKDGAIKEGVLSDAVHLTRKGYEIWAEAMSPLLAEMMVSDPVNDPTKPAPRDVRWFQRMHAIYVDQTKNKKFDLCFLGDSITQMWPGDMFGKHFGKYHAVNFGIGGDRTENVLWRLENGELAGTSPKVIVLLTGTNNQDMNTAEEVAVGITAVVRSLRTKCPQSRILLLGIFPSQDTPAEKTNAINAIVAKLDDGKMVRYLDVGAKLLGEDGTVQEGVLGDGVQLTRKGYEIWAEAMNPLLAEMMEK